MSSPDPGGATLSDGFRKIAAKVACAAGSPWAFMGALCAVVGWAVVGPFVGYSEGWELFINTGTTIVTFLMLFVLQSSQTRDTKAVNLKLDELLRAIEGARTSLANVGELSEREVERLEGEFRELATHEPATPAAAKASMKVPDEQATLESAR